MARQRWTAERVTDQSGRTAVITGANTGVGFHTAEMLARRGAAVVLACRDANRAARAVARIRDVAPKSQVSTLPLDLASLSSVREAADRLHAMCPRVDLLINNAGLGWLPLSSTADGFETHLGVNHLGHFAFTGLVLDLIRDIPGARIVTISSPAHRSGRLDLDDLQLESGYRRPAAYARSKLANLLFTYELQRRLEASDAAAISLAAHPGAARTEFNRSMPVLFRGPSWGLSRPITHPAQQGALSILRAATDPDAKGAEYYAPSGLAEFRGHPVRRTTSEESQDIDLQQRLWTVSEQLTKVSYDFVPSNG